MADRSVSVPMTLITSDPDFKVTTFLKSNISQTRRARVCQLQLSFL